MRSRFVVSYRRTLGVVGAVLFLWLMVLGFPPAVVGDQIQDPPSKLAPDTIGTIVPPPDTTAVITSSPTGPTTTTDLSVWDLLWLMLTL